MDIDKLMRVKAEALADQIWRDMLRDPVGAMTTAASNAAPATLTLEMLNQMVKDWRNMAARMRRDSTNIIVDMERGLDEPVEMYRHPTDGTFAEMSYRHAHAINREMPLIFVEAETPMRARFRPATRSDIGVPVMGLFPGPYDLPPGSPLPTRLPHRLVERYSAGTPTSCPPLNATHPPSLTAR